MSFSPHKLQCHAPLRNVRLVDGEQRRREEENLRQAREKAFQEGFEAGQKSIGEQVVQQRTQLVELQRGIFESLTRVMPGLATQCEAELVRLSLQCCKRVVVGLPITAEMVECVLKEALAEVQGIDQYTIRMHPEDLNLLREVESSTLPPPGQEKIGLAADPAIQRGGCILDTPFGTVDATRDSKFNHLEDLLR